MSKFLIIYITGRSSSFVFVIPADLLVTVQFRDNPGPGHPGVTLHSSSGGPKLYTVGKGDTSADWNLKSLNLQALQVPIGQWYVVFLLIFTKLV